MPIDATTGLPRSRALFTSRQMVSDAVTEPPGLSTRSTMADTESSAASLPQCRRDSVATGGRGAQRQNAGPPRPLTIPPAKVTTAIIGLERRPGIDGTGGAIGDRAAPA